MRVTLSWPDGQTVSFDLPDEVTVEVQTATDDDFRASLTAAETRVLTELAHRPDTRSRLAARLGVTTSTLDNQLAAIKRKLLDELATRGNAPSDGYLSMEAIIGWATRYMRDQKT